MNKRCEQLFERQEATASMLRRLDSNGDGTALYRLCFGPGIGIADGVPTSLRMSPSTMSMLRRLGSARRHACVDISAKQHVSYGLGQTTY